MSGYLKFYMFLFFVVELGMLNYSCLFDILRNLYAKILPNFLPVRYILELTHRCNLNCPYCYLGSNKLREEISFLSWKKIIEQIPPYSIITLVGGEVLIRDDFSEILSFASKKVFRKIHLVTNGILLDKVDLSKILLLSVSLDGYKENHDKFRGREGIFDKVMNNLENQTFKNTLVDIKTIVLKDNLEDILKLYELASNKGFDFFSISFLRNNNLKQNPILKETFDSEFYLKKYPIELYFDLDKFEEIYLEIQKIKKYSKTKIRFAPKFDNKDPKIELDLIKRFFLEYKYKDIKEIYCPCLYPYSNIIINPKGDVYPCLSYKIGNVTENSLNEIIKSKKYRDFKNNLKKRGVFEACQMCCELKVKK